MIKIVSIVPTIYLKNDSGVLKQLIRCRLFNDSNECSGVMSINAEPQYSIPINKIPSGEMTIEFFIDEVKGASLFSFSLVIEDQTADTMQLVIEQPKHWTVHVVQLSHHDLGYTDIASNVLKVYDKYLDEALDIADSLSDFPDDAKFRIVIEQMWSLDHFLKNVPVERVRKMIELLKSGQFEVTALFGNMTTEICGHETMLRSLYHAAALKREHDIPIISAEHNDITGFSWGLSRVLTDAGLKIFCPGIPLYYDWGGLGIPSFWKEEKVFGYKGPGAFWWEAPTGKRILFSSTNWGCGGDARHTFPNLEEKLTEFNNNGYPHSIIRWPVGGGFRDNSPYIAGYAETIRSHNEKWEFPHLISSTNAKFYKDFIKEIPDNLPVWRGELPGQDYPTGATTTAIPTGINRLNHSALISSEKLASIANLHTDFTYPQKRIDEAYEETLCYEEHAWAYHFPAGPAQRAGELEKELHAYKAQAYSRETSDKAMAYLVDNLKLDEDEMHLVVFNTTSWSKTEPVSIPMREYDSTGSEMKVVPPEKDDKGAGFLKVALLGNRNHVTPDERFTGGCFELMDLENGKSVEYTLSFLKDIMEPVPYAPQRLGLGGGSQRVGLFEKPSGIKTDICFIAKNIPAFGYKVYKMIPKKNAPDFDSNPHLNCEDGKIENEFYYIKVNSNGISSIYDKQTGRELIDSTGEDFYKLIVRNGNSPEITLEEICRIKTIQNGGISVSIEIDAKAHGHPAIRHRISLFTGVKNVYFESSILKDATPLLNASIGFCFKADEPSVRYESALSVIEPPYDFLPDAYSDSLAVQSWAGIQDREYHILWTSLDAPMVGFGKLWPGYMSPAHRCIAPGYTHDPQTEDDYRQNGWIFSQLFFNNCGTNFSVSQSGITLFRYVLTTGDGVYTDSRAVKWGWQNTTAFESMFTDRATKDGVLPSSSSFIDISAGDTAVLNWKRAQDGNGFILRLWNFGTQNEAVRVSFDSLRIKTANLTNPAEEDLNISCDVFDNHFNVTVNSGEITSIRMVVE